MAFTEGNQYYKLRSKHGRDKSITADEFLEGVNDYFKWVKDNPLTDYDRQTNKEVFRKRPLTVQGLCVHLQIHSKTFYSWENGNDDDYRAICAYARDVIENNQLEGAAAGIYVHSIVALKLGLANKHEFTGDIKVTEMKYIVPENPEPDGTDNTSNV